MKILRNYILKDFFSAFTFSLLSITMVMVLGNLIKLSDMVIRKGVALNDAVMLFLFFIPYLLGFTIPLSLLLGILLSLGRLIADNEIVAMHVAGISLGRILRIFLILGIIFSMCLFILNDKILPNFHYRYYQRIKNLYRKNLSAIIEPGVFLENFGNYILYVGDVKGNKLKNIFIYQIENDNLKQITFAKKGEFISQGKILKLKLENGFRDEVNPKNRNELYRLNFKIFFMDIPIEEKSKTPIKKKPKDLTMKELKEKIPYLRSLKIFPKNLLIEFHKRISISLSPLIFVILGFGVATLVRHREKSINFGVTFLLAVSYYLLLILGETLAEANIVAPSLGMWIPNIIFLSLGIHLIRKCTF
ncbi:MAG: hypothetical protein DRP72_03480 [Candidatus Omnitrophota bacterium]|nr:MAG: hypothetical protein DRP72_03480 [Candidatus Omnitrophota bacterium]